MVEPDEEIEIGDFYCPECGGEVGYLADGSLKCISPCSIFIGCGWTGKDGEPNGPLVKTDSSIEEASS